MSRLPDFAICLITDRRRLASSQQTAAAQIAALERSLDEAIDLVDLIQIREPDLPAAALFGLVQSITRRARGSRTRVIVNDRMDVAVAADAGGVHLRSDGPPVGRVREIAPKDWMVGRSIHAPAEAGASQDADYLVFGTVFPSISKPEGWITQGLDRLAQTVRVSRVPVLAVGGVTVERAAACRQVGAAGVAAISLFLPEGSAPEACGVRPAVSALRGLLE